MNRHSTPLGLIAALVAATACNTPAQKKEAEAAAAAADTLVMSQRASRIAAAIANDSTPADKPVALWKLPAQLNEISGLALTADGRLLTHQDQRGKVFEVDYRRGVIVKEFSLGSPAVHGDFESITIADSTIMLLTSNGLLYSFAEGKPDAVVPFKVRDTGLGVKCEFEGMTYEPASGNLLLACKHVHDAALKDSVIIFRLPLEAPKDAKPRKIPYLAIPEKLIVGSNGWGDFRPSDITINPVNGNYVIIASREQAIAEVTPAGAVVFSRSLPSGHPQAEGVAITKDHILIISDEAKGGPALITMYRWP